MEYKDTPRSRSLAAVIERDAKATTGVSLAKRACWHGGGFGLRVAGAGLGAGLALAGLGYGLDKAGEGYDRAIGTAKRLQEQQDFQARMTREQDQAEQKREKTFAAMMSQEREEFFTKLAATTLRSQGTVTGNLGLLGGQYVTLSVPPNTTIGLDPHSTVRAVASAPDMRAAIFDPPPQAPDSTSRLDQNRIQPAAGLQSEPSAKTGQAAPRPPVFEPPPQLRAISLPAGTMAKAGPALPAYAKPERSSEGRPASPRKSAQSEPLTCKGNLP